MKKSQFPFVLLILGLFSFSISILRAQLKVQLKDIYIDYKFNPASIDEPLSMNDGNSYTALVEGQEIVKYNYSDGQELETLFQLQKFDVEGFEEISDYDFSENEDKILITGAQTPFYRHSYLALYYLFDLKTKRLEPVSDELLLIAKLSPDGKYVAFVLNNNLYVKETATKKLTQITKDGAYTKIINGMPDWLYEEEFSLTSGFEWSADSRKIAFYRFDESRVKEYQLEYYYELYPDLYRYKYPKAGEENSRVSISVFDVVKNKTTLINTGSETDVYYPRIEWTSSADQLCIVRLNRLQNKADLLLANAASGRSHCFYSETDERYISEFTDDFATFIADDEVIIQSEKDGFMHFYRYSLDGKLINSVTKGNWEVDELLGIDSKNGLIYFTSTQESPLERHIYAVNFEGTAVIKLSTEKGVHSAVFSSTFDYYLDYYSSSQHPNIVSVRTKSGELIRTLESNSPLEEECSNFDFTTREFFNIKGPSGDTLFGYMFKPANFDSTQKYPLLIYVYGGPESQEVLNNWEGLTPWFQYLNQQGYMVACIDNRGSNGRGAAFKKSIYLQLGKYETEDQIAAARYLITKNYIDKERIGIFGWSYGGFMVLNCMMDKSNLFKIGVSVAPVTNWRFYDSAYTERFMRKPRENSPGYDDNSPLNKTGDLQGKLLLIHGMADDNVHMQNSTMLINELVEHNKQFDVMFYPNRNHGISGGNTRMHLFTKISEYILENL